MEEDIKKKIEAILFSIGKKINVEEIMRMTKIKDKAKVVSCLIELKKKYNDDEGNSLMILQDGDDWKLTIKDQYIDVAKEIGIETELTKTVMETLAVIAYKYPVLQSEVIKIRTNKAYDHLKELEELGYIVRERYGRTRKIKLTQKFFDYFDLPPDKLREKFKNVEEMEKAIEDKEHKIREIHELRQQKIEDQKREERAEARINIYMQNETNPNIREVLEKQKTGLNVIKEEKLGDLVVVDEEPLPYEKEEMEEKEMEKEDAEIQKQKDHVGELEIYEEPKNYIEPGLEDNKIQDTEEKENLEEDMDIDEQDIKESKSDDSDETEEEIEDIQDMKDKINSEEDQVKDDDVDKAEDQKEDSKNEDNASAKGNIDDKNEDQASIEDEEKDNEDDAQDENIFASHSGVIEKEEEDIKDLKEEGPFTMEGLPDAIKEKVDERAREILGEKKHKKDEKNT